MKDIMYDIEQEELIIRNRSQPKQIKIGKLYELKEQYIINNYDKSKEELLIIHEVLNNFMDYIVKVEK